jgi:hypothetical protein
MAPAQAVAALRACIESGEVILTKHAIDEMLADGISRIELFRVLENGNIFQPAEQDMKTGEWKYRVESNITGRPIASVFKFVRIDRTVIITVFEVR